MEIRVPEIERLPAWSLPLAIAPAPRRRLKRIAELREPRVVIADRALLLRESMRLAVEASSPARIVGETARGREIYEQVERLRPDLLVLDLLLGDTDGASVLRELKRRRLRVPTLVLSRVTHPAFVRDAFAAGATGYALKTQPLREVITAMNAVAGKTRYLAPALVEAGLTTDPEQLPLDPGPFDDLSAREREVFWRLVEGWSTKSVAAQMCISNKTVEAHRLSLNRKLGVRSATQLIRLAVIEGLI